MSCEGEVVQNPDGSLSYPVWLKTPMGGWIRRDALDIDSPHHPYNMVKAAGFVPEEYGLHHPIAQKYKILSRDEMIALLVEQDAHIRKLEKLVG